MQAHAFPNHCIDERDDEKVPALLLQQISNTMPLLILLKRVPRKGIQTIENMII